MTPPNLPAVDLDRLKGLAEKALKYWPKRNDWTTGFAAFYPATYFRDTYIAAASPAVVLFLIQRLQEAEVKAAHLHEVDSYQADHIASITDQLKAAEKVIGAADSFVQSSAVLIRSPATLSDFPHQSGILALDEYLKVRDAYRKDTHGSLT